MCKLLKMIICRLSQESTDQLLLNGTRTSPSVLSLLFLCVRQVAGHVFGKCSALKIAT